MTIQNKSFGRIGPIQIGGGFRHRATGPTAIYPLERLVEFLNTNPSDEKQIIDFCNKYTYLPQKIGSSLQRVFKKEQKQLRQIADRLVAGVKLTDKEIAKVNKRLSKIKSEIQYVEGSQLASVNNSLGGPTKDLNERNKEQFTLVLKRHGGTNVALWQDLIELYTRKRLDTCLQCGKFFLKLTKHEKIYCDDVCRYKHHNQKIT